MSQATGRRRPAPRRNSTRNRQSRISREPLREHNTRMLLGHRAADVPLQVYGNDASLITDTSNYSNADNLRHNLIHNNPKDINESNFNAEDVSSIFSLYYYLSNNGLANILLGFENHPILIGFRRTSIEQIHKNLIKMIKTNKLERSKLLIIKKGISDEIDHFNWVTAETFPELEYEMTLKEQNKHRIKEYTSLNKILDMLTEKLRSKSKTRKSACKGAGCAVMGGGRKTKKCNTKRTRGKYQSKK